MNFPCRILHFVDRASLYNLQLKPPWCTIFLSMFISFSTCFWRLCAHHQEK